MDRIPFQLLEIQLRVYFVFSAATVLIQPGTAATAQEDADAARPPAVEILRTVQDGAGFGMELHRVTISGVAKNRAGKPIARAEVFVASAARQKPGGFESLRGKTVTDSDGRFQLKDIQLLVVRTRPDPLPKPTEGRFTVFAAVQGYGFTWHPTRVFRPADRPDDPPEGDLDLETTERAFYQDEPITIDLVFEPAAKVRGRITDDLGRPIADAKIQVGYVDSVRDPTGSGMWSCSYLGSEDNGDEPNSFDAIRWLPAKYRETRTDEDGRYVLRYLRRDTSYLTQIDPSLAHDPFAGTVATSTKQQRGRTISTGYEGQLDREFEAPRDVTVSIKDKVTGKPAAGVVVTAYHQRRYRRDGARKQTDDRGETLLRLPPGDYTLFAEPTSDAWLFKSEKVTVGEDERAVLPIDLEPAAIVILKATNANTRQPIPGVQFESQTDQVSQLRPLSSQTVFVDDPATNREGVLRVSVPPGPRQFVMSGWNPGQTDGIQSEMVDLIAGETTEIKFNVTEKSAGKATLEPMFADFYPAHFGKNWEKQTRLSASAKVRLKMRITNTYKPEGIDSGKLFHLLKKLNPNEVYDLQEIIEKFFDTRINLARRVLTVDGDNRRAESYYGPGSRNARLDANGKPLPYSTGIVRGDDRWNYRSGSNQADLGVNSAVDSLSSLWQRPATRQPAAAAPGQESRQPPKPTISESDERITFDFEAEQYVSRYVCDKETGFVQFVGYGASFDRFTKMSFYFAPQKYSSGLMLPSAMISWTVRNGEIGPFRLRMIDAVEIVDQFAPSEFALSLPAGQ